VIPSGLHVAATTAYNGNPTADLSKLNTQELQQLRTALAAIQH
jgi:hypothetical protein